MDVLISRQAAIDELKKISFSYWFECGVYLSEDRREIEIISSSKALEAIEALPFVQREQKTGRWIHTDDYDAWRCSECEEYFCLDEGTPQDNEYYYCPCCGAKMRMEND